MLYYDEKTTKINKKDTVLLSRDLIPDVYLKNNERYFLIMYPLFFQNEQFGFMLFDFNNRNSIIVETLRRQISSAIKGSLLINEIKQISLEAKMANKYKSEFLANISHEIRTPMNAIIGFSEIISDSKAEKNNKNEYYANIITKESVRLVEMINQLLDISKIEAGKMELQEIQFTINALIEKIEAIFNNMAEKKGLYFKIVTDSELPEVLLGDFLRITQILINVIGNAIKFTDDGGVTLKISIKQRKEDLLVLYFEITDTGIGISSNKRKMIFESFNQENLQISSIYGGTGLGMAISRQYVRLMGGKIGVFNNEEQGVTFWFFINTKPMESVNNKMKDPEKDNKQFIKIPEGIRILFVEDYPVNREVGVYHLEREKCKVIIAINGKDALEKFKNNEFDIILMDIKMPEMDGITAARQIRSLDNGKTIPIIAMTANAFESDKQECLDSGMNDFLAKPLLRNQLVSKVSEWINKKERINSDDDKQEDNIPIDLTKFIENMNNDEVMANKILSGFLDILEGQLEEIKQCIIEKDVKTVQREAHSIKGGALNFMANGLMVASKKLESLAKSGSLENAMDLLDKIKEEYLRIIKYVKDNM